MAPPMRVEVVSPEGLIWEGEAINVVVRSTSGELGILYDHWPIMAPLVPGAVEIQTPDGEREVIAVEGGFISVFQNRVQVLSDSAMMASKISVEQARTALAALRDSYDAGTATESEQRRYNQL